MIGSTAMALLLVFLSLSAPIATRGDPLYIVCSNITRSGTENFISNSMYSSNLNHLVSTLSSSASASASATGFASYTTGTIPDSIYGFLLCRGDIDPDTCDSCFSTAISDIRQLCPNSKGATIWYDYCQLSYSNPDYLLHPDVEKNVRVFMWNAQSYQQYSRFEILATLMIGNLSDFAVTNTSQLFATGETALPSTDKIYGMVQCSRDMDVGNCRTCLKETVNSVIAEERMRGKRGGRALGLWCSIRYEIYKFYNGTSMLNLSSKKAPSITINPQQPADLSHGGKKTIIRRVAIFLSLGLVLIVISIICLILMKKRSDKGTNKSQKDQTTVTHGIDLASQLTIRESNLELPLIKFSSIVEATDNFSTINKLGQGGFGSVYKCQLPEGESIAVKRLDACSGQGLEEFLNEIKLIAKLQHQNLVKLLGCCVQGDEKLLVYEYMANNSLDYHLFDPIRKEQLDWTKRFAIIDGIAQGILYLHKYSRVRIIHRDLKASNILLDLDMKPKISDFGMARIFDANTIQANTNRIVGTYGYMSPEYAMEGIFSIKSDVFSFGVLMLEIISGKRNTTFHKFGKALNLLSYAWELWKNGHLLDFVDPSLCDKNFINEIYKCIIVALTCVQENALDRPVMPKVIDMLGSENATLPDPKKPAFFTTEIEEASRMLINELATQNDITLTILEGR